MKKLNVHIVYLLIIGAMLCAFVILFVVMRTPPLTSPVVQVASGPESSREASVAVTPENSVENLADELYEPEASRISSKETKTSSKQASSMKMSKTSSSRPSSSVKASSQRPASVNINAASADEIYEVLTGKGIGPKKAQAIVDYRTEHGAFQTVEDLLEVSGIGEKTLEKIRPYVRLQ